MTHADWQTVRHNGLTLHLTNHASFSSALCSTTLSVALDSVAQLLSMDSCSCLQT